MPETPNQQNAESTAKVPTTAPASVLEYSAQSGVSSYAIDIPQSLLETELPGIAIAVQDLGRFAVVLQVPAEPDVPNSIDNNGPADFRSATLPQPLNAIDAAVTYQAALQRTTRCYAEVMPVIALDHEPNEAFRRVCASLDVQLAVVGQALVNELLRLTSEVSGYTWPTGEQVEAEKKAIKVSWE